MAANTATQIQVSTLAIRSNSSVLTTSAGCSAAAYSRANGLPISTLTSAARKIPALPSASSHRSIDDSLSANVSTASTKSAVMEPISSVPAGFPVLRPNAKPARATANATTTAALKGTLPTSTQ